MKNLNKIIFTLLITSLAKPVLAAHPSIEKIYKTDTGSISGKTLRYYQIFGDQCIHIQTLKPGTSGEPDLELNLCTLNNKSFMDSYSDVILEDAKFTKNNLEIKLKTIPLDLSSEKTFICKISIGEHEINNPDCTEE